MIYSPTKNDPVFCDYLDVTYSPDDLPSNEVTDLIQSVGAEAIYTDDYNSKWRCGAGVLSIDTRPRYARISASGQVLVFLRGFGLFNDYLSALSSTPHKVTRLDAALDLPLDGADVVSKLRTEYPRVCNLTRKAQSTLSILASRALDGRETGSWSCGNRKTSKVMASVYDKTHEAWEKRKEMLPLTTRFEVRVRGDVGPSMRDASAPASLFYHYAAPALLSAPVGIPLWQAGWGGEWSHNVVPLAPGDILKRRVGSSADLAALIDLADRAGPEGRSYLLSLLSRRIGALPAGDGLLAVG
jgi:hypothetical protein